MEDYLLIDYISQYLNQQRCSNHQEKQAKILTLSKNISQSFLCSECMEECNRNQSQQFVSIKRANERIKNFINFSSSNYLRLSQVQTELNSVRQQYSQIYSSFNGLIDKISNQIKFRKDIYERNQTSFDFNLGQVRKQIEQFRKIQSLDDVDYMKQVKEKSSQDQLKNVLLGLLQKETLLQNSNRLKIDKTIEILNNTILLAKNLLADQYQQLQQLINQEEELLSLLNENFDSQMNNTLSNSKSFVNSSQIQNPKMISYAQASSALQCQWKFNQKRTHQSLKFVQENKLHIPYNPHDTNNKDTNIIRLALIQPFIQEGPIQQPRSITFQMNSMINSIICVGICDQNQAESKMLLHKETKPYIFFNSIGLVQTRELVQSFQTVHSPTFQRGDIITLLLKPQNHHIQLIKNYIYNQPFQIELLNNEEWKWTNMVFAVGAQGIGGGDIHILEQ